MNKEEKGRAHAYKHNTRARSHTHTHTHLLMTTYCGKMPQVSKQNIMALISNLDVYDNQIFI